MKMTSPDDMLYCTLIPAAMQSDNLLSFLYSLVDASWDISQGPQGDRGTQKCPNYALFTVFIDPRFKNNAIRMPREIQRTGDRFLYLVLRFKPVGFDAETDLCGLVLRPRAQHADDDDALDDGKLAWSGAYRVMCFF